MRYASFNRVMKNLAPRFNWLSMRGSPPRFHCSFPLTLSLSKGAQLVVRAVDGVDFEFATVARAGVDVADRHRLPVHLEDVRVQCLHAGAQAEVRLGRRLGDDAGLEYLLQDQVRRHL